MSLIICWAYRPAAHGSGAQRNRSLRKLKVCDKTGFLCVQFFSSRLFPGHQEISDYAALIGDTRATLPDAAIKVDSGLV